MKSAFEKDYSSAKTDINGDANISMKNNKNSVYTFFIFLNTSSGGNKANILLNLNLQKSDLENLELKGSNVRVYVFNLKDTDDRLKGLAQLKNVQETGFSLIRVIIGGGDGSIIWAIQEILEAKISLENCPIGIIPFGTGNALSKLFGWGATAPKGLPGNNLTKLKNLISEWMDAEILDLDIWDVSIETYENGGIKKVYKPQGEKFEEKFLTIVDSKSEKEVRLTNFNKLMSIVYTFGLDGCIGYNFDKRRVASRIRNLLILLMENFKNVMKKPPQFNDIVDSIQITKQNKETPEEIKSEHVETSSHNLFLYPATDLGISQAKNKGHTNASFIKENPPIFLVSNTPNYAGVYNPWQLSKGKIDTESVDGKKVAAVFEDQRIDDGTIEMLSLKGPLGMIFCKFARIGQTKGPIVINFKKSENEAQPIHTHMHIDGEYFSVIAPKRVKISLCSQLPQGKIKIMKKAAQKSKKAK